MAKRELNEQQKKFIEVLFAEAGGNPHKARQLAGYSEGYNTKVLMETLKEEVIEATQLYMNAPRAAMALSLIHILTLPTKRIV